VPVIASSGSAVLVEEWSVELVSPLLLPSPSAPTVPKLSSGDCAVALGTAISNAAANAATAATNTGLTRPFSICLAVSPFSGGTSPVCDRSLPLLKVQA
jgi:hypothetical protein